MRKLWLGTVVLLAFTWPGSANGSSGIIKDGTRIARLAVHYFDESSSNAQAVVRVEKVFTDHEKRGFFKIGVLPLIICENATVEVRSSNHFTNALRMLQESLMPRKKSLPVEVRQVTVKLWGDNQVLLQARAVFLGKGDDRLLDVILRPSQVSEVRFNQLHLGEAVEKLQEVLAEKQSAAQKNQERKGVLDTDH